MILRKAERRDAEALGRLGAMLMRTHYAFDPRRFLAPMEGSERGYASFLAGMLDSPDASGSASTARRASCCGRRRRTRPRSGSSTASDSATR